MSEKEVQTVSVNAFERAAKEQLKGSVTESWFGTEVNIRRTLPLVEMLRFVKDLTEACFLEDGTFVPEMMEFTVKSGILTYYANFRLPENLKKQYELIYGTDAVDMVRAHINLSQLNEIVEAANRKIEYLCDSDIRALRAKLDELVSAMKAVGEETSSMFEGVDPADVQKLIGSLEGGGVDERKIVDAYLSHMEQQAPECVDEGTAEMEPAAK